MATSLSILFSDLRLPRTEEQTSEEELLLPPPISKLDGQYDLLLEILTRALTDPGSAARSKSVCKNWNSLLSNPCFFPRFIQHKQQRHVVDETLLKESILSFLPQMSAEARAKFRILDRAKDLTLCGCHRQSFFFLFVCNHYTKQLVAIPPPVHRQAESRDPHHCFLACNPRSEHQFRVLLVRPRDRTLHYFCSESKNWTDSEIHGPYSFKEMTVWNGKRYWLNSQPERVVEYNPYGNCESSRPLGAVMFDAEAAILYDKRKAFPSSVLRVSGGDLHVVRLRDSGSLSVWRLDDDSKQWRMLYEVYTDRLTWCEEEKDEGLVLDSVIGQHPENPEVVFLQFFGCSIDDSTVVACNLRTRTLQRVENGLPRPKSSWATVVHNYNKLQ